MVNENKTYKMLDLVGTSTESVEGAIRFALKRTTQTIRNIDWFELKEVRGRVEKGDVAEFQVRLEVGFRLEDT